MRIRARVAQRLSGYRTLAVWGASGLGRNALARWLPADKVSYCVDNNPVRVGGALLGKPVVAPSELAR
jgi:hypothetical protein